MNGGNTGEGNSEKWHLITTLRRNVAIGLAWPSTTSRQGQASFSKRSRSRERSTEAGTEEGSVVERGTTGLDIDAQHLGQFRVERESAFVTTLTLHGNGQLLEVDAGVAKRRALGGADAGAIEKREQCAIAQTEDGVGLGLG